MIADLRELAALTSTADGAQRVAWGPVWRQARAWFAGKVAALGHRVETDAAGNNWVTIPGGSPGAVIVGSHLDSVPNGGWLDGALGMIAALEAIRVHGAATPASTLKLVDWADEEGRFGMSLLGSSAAAGRLDAARAREAVDRHGVRLVDALADNGVALDRMTDAHVQLKAADPRAYLELHIEQGPVLASLDRPLGVVVGSFGVERHMLTFTGQAAHAGSTPIPMRRDAFLAAAATALECRELARRRAGSGGAVCTVGVVEVDPNIPTAVPQRCRISLDQRALDAGVLAAMLDEARHAADRAARDNNVGVEWTPLWRIEPRPFDGALVGLCEEAVREETGGDAPRLPSGPVHDATSMAGLMPAVMMFAASPNGLSHCKEEDTPEPMLEQAIRAYVRLVGKTIDHVAPGIPRSPKPEA
jgi:N-carbamoyl-L-amino-acid hydrolase